MSTSGQKAYYSKNSRVREASRFGVASNAFGLLANLSKFTATGIGLWGDPTNSRHSAASAWLGTIGAASGFFGATTGIIAGFNDKRNRKNIAKTAREMKLRGENDSNNNLESNKKQEIDNLKDAFRRNNIDQQQANAYKKRKQEMNTLKAKKYAMQQAADLNEISGKKLVGGFAGALGSLASTGVSLFNSIPALKDLSIKGFPMINMYSIIPVTLLSMRTRKKG